MAVSFMNLHSISSPLKLGGLIITDSIDLKKKKMSEKIERGILEGIEYCPRGALLEVHKQTFS